MSEILYHTIRKIDLTIGEVTTIGGSAKVSGYQDGVASNTLFSHPNGLVVTQNASTSGGTELYIADTMNRIIRRIVIGSGEVTTFAGNLSTGLSRDGTVSWARFQEPSGMALLEFYGEKQILLTDSSAGTIRQIFFRNGETHTLAGGLPAYQDGIGTSAGFLNPTVLSFAYETNRFNNPYLLVVDTVSSPAGFVSGIRLLNDSRQGYIEVTTVAVGNTCIALEFFTHKVEIARKLAWVGTIMCTAVSILRKVCRQVKFVC